MKTKLGKTMYFESHGACLAHFLQSVIPSLVRRINVLEHVASCRRVFLAEGNQFNYPHTYQGMYLRNFISIGIFFFLGATAPIWALTYLHETLRFT
jgi:hypothetical protein